jgi:hypothetical protein
MTRGDPAVSDRPCPVWCHHADGTHAAFHYVRTLPPADRAALRELLPPGGDERVAMVIGETACDDTGSPPPADELVAFVRSLTRESADRLYKTACCQNRLPLHAKDYTPDVECPPPAGRLHPLRPADLPPRAAAGP